MVDQQEIIDRLTRRNLELEAELEEFQQSSRDLERELEAQLEQSEKRNSDLTAANSRLTLEVENVKLKLSEVSTSTSEHISELEQELKVTKETNEQLIVEIRDLEQSNDDLERAQRALAASLEEFESKFNEQIEKNVFLECELGEKSDLEIMIQRLKDEVRDLKQELQIQEQRSAEIASSHHHRYPRRTGSINSPVVTVGPTTTSVISTPTTAACVMNNNVLSKPCLKKTMIPVPALSPTSPTSNGKDILGRNPQIMNSSTRVSALNIVSDLLRKVGALESKLAACRNLVPPGTPIRSRQSMSITPTTSPTSTSLPPLLTLQSSTSPSKISLKQTNH